MINKEDYISQVVSLIKNKNTKREIKNEIEAHIEDRIKYYTDAGYELDCATKKAVEKMGSAEDVAKSMAKLHNNTLWVILSILLMIFYIVGLIIANIKFYDFSIINMVDFTEVNEFGSFISVLIFLAGTLAFYTAVKSRNSLLLILHGVISIATPVVSMYAMIPFGYQLVSIVTDFPAAIIAKESFFNSNEIFWKLDDLFPSGIPLCIYYTLTIICILISLLCVVWGIISLVYAKELNLDKRSNQFEIKVKRFSTFLIILSVAALAGTCAEGIYDFAITARENKAYEENLTDNVIKAKEEFDALIIPQSADEVKTLAIKKGLQDYDISEMEYGMLMVYQNDAYTIQIRDDDEDGIYESKRLFSAHTASLSKENKAKLTALEKGSRIENLIEIADFSNITDYTQTVDGDITAVSVSIYCAEDEESYAFEYENGILVETFFDEEEERL